MITQDRLKELLYYNKDTGGFTWLVATARRVKVGNVAGSKNKCSYIELSIDYKLYLAHRLAWLYTYGSFPIGQIDHINGIRDDNRIMNLRDVTFRENSQNQKKRKRPDQSMPTGVQVVSNSKAIQNAYRAHWNDASGKQLHSPNFNFKKCGSKENALSQAIAYREARILEMNEQGANYTNRHGT